MKNIIKLFGLGKAKQSKVRSQAAESDDSLPATALTVNASEILVPISAEFRLGSQQVMLLELMERTSKNLFITGRAGTGKSLLLNRFVEQGSKRTVVVAPTGIAALNVGGETIHSVFGLPPRFVDEFELKERALPSERAELLKHIETLIIDEISMVRADLFDGMDIRLRQVRKNEEPFGGVQIVAFGDPSQLPPIVEDAEIGKYFQHNLGGYWFFHSRAWQRGLFEAYELTENFRQRDGLFLEILDGIRDGRITESQLSSLNERFRDQGNLPQEGAITITFKNSEASSTNSVRLSRLLGTRHVYSASIEGNFSKKTLPADPELELKVGAQVMCLKNIQATPIRNGTICTVESLTNDKVQVILDGVCYGIQRESWDSFRYDYDSGARRIDKEPTGRFTQMPLRLAWAVTAHKSQGKTFERVVVDLRSGAFAEGQAYVALSRCPTLQETFLAGKMRRSDVRVNPDAATFMRSLLSPS